MPYFFQNLAEAEYVVTLYQYMRLLGYPADKISMLTTYNGQKALLKDVVERRCAHHPAFGVPHKVTASYTHGHSWAAESTAVQGPVPWLSSDVLHSTLPLCCAVTNCTQRLCSRLLCVEL